jgi:hypothetical protein
MKRKKSATVGLMVRMKEPLRAKIEKAAKARGVSMNTEATSRLERSFSEGDFVEVVRDALRDPDGPKATPSKIGYMFTDNETYKRAAAQAIIEKLSNLEKQFDGLRTELRELKGTEHSTGDKK